MSGPLGDSPCKILRQLLVDAGLGTDTPGQDWQVKAGIEPDDPANCLTCYDDTNVLDGRTQPDHEYVEQHGIQVKVRSYDKPTGFAKAAAIFLYIAEQIYNNVTNVGPNKYYVHHINWTGGVLAVGKEPTTQRFIHTINGTMRIRQH
jgi:hypothetical protein